MRIHAVGYLDIHVVKYLGAHAGCYDPIVMIHDNVMNENIRGWLCCSRWSAGLANRSSTYTNYSCTSSISDTSDSNSTSMSV